MTIHIVDDSAPGDNVRRDRWSRYLVVRPDGGKPVGYSRATTIAKALDDTSNLMNWGKRMVALGLAVRPDLLALVQAADADDKKELDKVCERASEAGGATARRDLGTALHTMVEKSHADPSWKVPDAYAADVHAVNAAIAAAGYEVVTGMSEIMVVLDRHEIAGTADLVLRRISDGALFIADLKTGASVKYGALAWAIQLSVYAAADNLYQQGPAKDGTEDVRLPMPTVDQSTALILHVQPGSGACDVHSLDIEAGRAALEVAMQVRTWRKAKGLLVPHQIVDGGAASIPPGATPVPVTSTEEYSGQARHAETSSVDAPVSAADAIAHQARVAWVLRRVDAIKAAGHLQTMGQQWPTGVAKPQGIRDGSGTWSATDLDALVTVLDRTEGVHDMPFGEPDPQLTATMADAAAERDAVEAAAVAAAEARPPVLEPSPDDGTIAAETDVQALRNRIIALPAEQLVHLKRWVEEGAAAGVAWNTGPSPTVRRFTITSTALVLAGFIDPVGDQPDQIAKAAMRFITDLPIDPHPVGAVLGTLTVEQCAALVQMLDTAEVRFDTFGIAQITAAA